METLSAHPQSDQPVVPVTVAHLTLRCAWHAIRLPLLTLLVILEPLMRTILMGVAMLGVLMAFFWEFVVRPPHFPFWLMLGASIGCAMLLLPWYALMSFLSQRRRRAD